MFKRIIQFHHHTAILLAAYKAISSGVSPVLLNLNLLLNQSETENQPAQEKLTELIWKIALFPSTKNMVLT